MSHRLYRVTKFDIIADFTILVAFDDGSKQVINFEPVLHGQMWGPLRELAVFNQVVLDPTSGTLTWPNGADFDPETLHNWQDYKDELSARAQQWQTQSV